MSSAPLGEVNPLSIVNCGQRCPALLTAFCSGAGVAQPTEAGRVILKNACMLVLWVLGHVRDVSVAETFSFA